MCFEEICRKNEVYCMNKNDVLSIEPLLIGVKEVAKMLCLCEKTIRNLTKRGELPAVRIGSSVRYCREDLIEFIRQRSTREASGGNE